MKKYTEYKCSGVDWIGEIPNTWEIIPLKRLTQVKRGASPRPIEDPKYFDENGEFGWVRIADVTASDRYLENTTQKLSELGASLSVKRYPGDLFLSIAGTVGKPIISKIKCCIHDGFVWFPDLTINPEFLYYIFSADLAYQGLGKLGTQLNLNTDTVGYIKLPLPSREEICQIVKSLDKNTAKIDNLISKKQKLIDLLKEERAVIINQAVSKGIDPNVEMKDSGIEWLGKVPKHWRIVPLKKYLLSLVDYRGKTPTKKENGEVFLVTARNIKDGIINYSLSQEYISKDEYPQVMQRGKPIIGDVLFTTEAPLGEAANVDREDIALAQRIIKFRANPKYLDNYYLKEWLMSQSFQNDLQSYATGSTALGIKASKLNFLKLLLPPLNEQAKILDQINKDKTKIDTSIVKIEKEINLLQEYRTALISEVVTGKIDVREEVAVWT